MLCYVVVVCVWLSCGCVGLLRLMLCFVVLNCVVVDLCCVDLRHVSLRCVLFALGCVGHVLCRVVSSLRCVVLRCAVSHDDKV